MTEMEQTCRGEIEPLLNRLLEGDENAKDGLIALACEQFRTHASKMLRQNFRRLSRWEETGDILQTAMMRLHSSLKVLKPDSPESFGRLAATQIRRTLIDLSRHHFGPQGAAANHHTDGISPSPLIDVQPDGDLEPQSLEEWTKFHQQVEELPDEEQTVFSLIFYDGLNQTETAKILGISDRTVRQRWKSAKVILHKRLSDSEMS